ncbi:MAG: SUMF1/EgtB/PvdO family nonheme iron enzyme [Candidatus Micrarchaeota archaeon]
MRKLLVLVIFASLLFAGCSQPAKPTPTPMAPSAKPIIKISATPIVDVSPTPPPTPIMITSGPSFNITNLTAFIIWQTNVRSNSVVEWGNGADYGMIQSLEANSTTHKMNISDLKYSTTYHFRVASCFGIQCNKSEDFNFTTVHKPCPSGSAYFADGDFCLDNFEETLMSYGISKAISQAGGIPFVSISRADAEKSCNLAGKRLCTSKEFNTACNIDGQKYGPIGNVECQLNNYSFMAAGYARNCTSREGPHDMIGNVWEWVSDSVISTTPYYEGLVDREDILTAGRDYQPPRQPSSVTENFGGDYYFNLETNPNSFIGKGITRGGAFNSFSRGGCFAYQVGVPLGGAPNIGYRCCS